MILAQAGVLGVVVALLLLTWFAVLAPLVKSLAQAPSGGLERLLQQLAVLGRQAQDAGYDAAARATGELLSGLRGAAGPEAVENQLRQGLVRLQQAIGDATAASESNSAAAGTHPAANSLAQDPELVADFILESREHLTSIEQRILTLEREPANADAIHSVFRGFHTIKGLAGFLEFTAIREVAHEVETALNLAREGKLAVTPAVIDVDPGKRGLSEPGDRRRGIRRGRRTHAGA